MFFVNCLCVFILNLQNSLNILNYFRQISIIFSVFCLFIFIWLKKHISDFSKESALLELFINREGDVQLHFSLCILRYKVIPELSFCLIEFECREYQRSIWGIKCWEEEVFQCTHMKQLSSFYLQNFPFLLEHLALTNL